MKLHRIRKESQHINKGNDEKSVYSITAGPRLVYNREKLSAALNFYYQTGNNPGIDWVTGTGESTNQKIGAYNIGLDVAYKASDNIVPKVASIEFGYSHMLPTESMLALKE